MTKTKAKTSKNSKARNGYKRFLNKNIFIRTVTNFYTGKLVETFPGELIIIDAAWIADTKRWGETLRTGQVNEAEPYPDGEVVVNRGGIIDVCRWTHELIRVAT